MAQASHEGFQLGDMMESPESTDYHPLLNDLVLSTLTPHIGKPDLTTFRHVCVKWRDAVDWKFRQDCWINLCNQSRLYKFLYEFQMDLMQVPGTQNRIPFDSFSLAEISSLAKNTSPLPFFTKLPPIPMGLSHYLFYNQLLPSIKQLQLKPEYISIGQLRKILRAAGKSLRVLEIQVDENVTTRTRIFRENDEMVPLLNLQKILWLTALDIIQDAEVFEGWSTEGTFNVGFLNDIYSSAFTLQHIECPVDASNHLLAIHDLISRNVNKFQNLRVLKLGVINQSALETLHNLGQYVHLLELGIEGIGNQVQGRTLTQTLFQFKDTLTTLDIGKVIERSREQIFVIELPTLKNLKRLRIHFSAKMKFHSGDLSHKTPILKDLCIVGDSKDEDCLDGFYHMQSSLESLQTLENLLECEVHYENLAGFAELFPNVKSLTLGKPSKNAMKILWTLWRNLKELKIITACHFIDEVLTGIPYETCQKMLANRNYDQEILNWYWNEPSIRKLRKLERLEINGQMSSKFHSLSCLPSDVSAYMALIHLPELHYLVVHRSLISNEASQKLDESMANWTSKIDPIQLKYDETIEAFRFHQNHQKFMKLLCRYPHQSLNLLPDFINSLWMNNQLDI